MILSADLVDVAREGLLLALILSVPILGAALLAGILTSLVQMFTKASEPLMGHVIRTVAIVAVLIIAAPWIAGEVAGFADRVWSLVQTTSM